MRLVNTKLLFLNTADRDEGKINNATFHIPKELLMVGNDQFMRLTLVDSVIPYQWYNTESYNNKFAVFMQTSDLPAGQWSVVSIPEGTYTAISAKSKLKTILNDPTNATYFNPVFSAQVITWNITYDFDTGKYTYSGEATNLGQTITSMEFDFSSTHGISVDMEETCNDLMGFAIDSYTFNPSIVSPLIATIQQEEAVYIRCNLQMPNLMFADGQFTPADILARVPLLTPPYSNVVYANLQNDMSFLLNTKYIDTITLSLTNENSVFLDIQANYQLTFKFDTLEPDPDETNLKELVHLSKLSLVQGDLKQIEQVKKK